MVEFSDPAKKDLREIFKYIARESRYYAEKVVTTMVEKTELLKGLPEMGREI